MNVNAGPEISVIASEIVAAYVDHEIALDAARPGRWLGVPAVGFCHNWQGKNHDPERETRVQSLWSTTTLYFRFECRYRELCLFDNSDASGRRGHLWDRDVAEVFLQPDRSRPGHYKEFEISPNGMWVDLDISPDGQADLDSGLKRSVLLDDRQRTWVAELAIPIGALTPKFDPDSSWGVNFFRIEGAAEPRAYHAWQPTFTPQADFHVPEAFGQLRFAPAPR